MFIEPMILIAGISPRIKKLDQNPRRCPVCGLHQAYYQRIDHYFNLFFIPLFRLKKGDPFIMCERCQRTLDEFGEDVSQFRRETGQQCGHCGKPVEKTFRFCPFCGKRI